MEKPFSRLDIKKRGCLKSQAFSLMVADNEKRKEGKRKGEERKTQTGENSRPDKQQVPPFPLYKLSSWALVNRKSDTDKLLKMKEKFEKKKSVNYYQFMCPHIIGIKLSPPSPNFSPFQSGSTQLIMPSCCPFLPLFLQPSPEFQIKM